MERAKNEMLAHPRDIYATLAGIWVSLPYWHVTEAGAGPIRRMRLDDELAKLDQEDLENSVHFMDKRIKELTRDLANMKRIRTITKDFLDDLMLNNERS